MKLTEKSPSVLGKAIISDSKGSLGIKSGELKSGCPNNEMQIRKKLNTIFFTLILFFEGKNIQNRTIIKAKLVTGN